MQENDGSSSTIYNSVGLWFVSGPRSMGPEQKLAPYGSVLCTTHWFDFTLRFNDCPIRLSEF